MKERNNTLLENTAQFEPSIKHQYGK